MIDTRIICEIHRLAHEGLSVRKIATILGLSRQTTSTYLADPPPQRPLMPRPSQLDRFKDEMARLLEIAPKVSAAVRRQRLTEHGFAGGITIVRDSLRGVRGATTQTQPVMRFASAPGEPCQIDWGHVGAMA
jgi:transposase